jgi:molybdopterin molybdotransferase
VGGGAATTTDDAMISLPEALDKIDRAVKPLASAGVPVADAAGCRLAQPIRSPIDVPQFSSSSMDGVAIRVADLEGDGPWRLPVQTVIAAGDAAHERLAAGCAAKIMTGAPLIDGADAVIPVEDVRFVGGDVVIESRPAEWSFVRPAGDDTRAGDHLFDRGDALGPVDCGVLAAVGFSSVEVIPRPRVSVVTTGSEVVDPGTDLAYGQLYNSNRVVLQSMLRSDGIELGSVVGAVPDDPTFLARSLEDILRRHDVVITTGGVSMGDFDYVPSVIKNLGGAVLFHKVRVKPGKPVFVAQALGCWLLGLPGNPVSVVAGYHLYARRVFSLLQGKTHEPRAATARLKDDLRVTGTRLCLVGAHLEMGSDGVAAVPSQRQRSGRLSSIRGMNGLLFIPEEIRELKAGDTVHAEWLF